MEKLAEKKGLQVHVNCSPDLIAELDRHRVVTGESRNQLARRLMHVGIDKIKGA